MLSGHSCSGWKVIVRASCPPVSVLHHHVVSFACFAYCLDLQVWYPRRQSVELLRFELVHQWLEEGALSGTPPGGVRGGSRGGGGGGRGWRGPGSALGWQWRCRCQWRHLGRPAFFCKQTKGILAIIGLLDGTSEILVRPSTPMKRIG